MHGKPLLLLFKYYDWDYFAGELRKLPSQNTTQPPPTVASPNLPPLELSFEWVAKGRYIPALKGHVFVFDDIVTFVYQPCLKQTGDCEQRTLLTQNPWLHTSYGARASAFPYRCFLLFTHRTASMISLRF